MAIRIAVVDSSIANYATIISNMAPGIEVIVIDATQDGWAQLAGQLASYTGITTLDIISHGAAGSVQLGNQVLVSANLAAYSQLLADIGSHFAPGADVLLYGGDIGAGTAGQGFVTALGQALNADVAASADTTGAAALGGNWLLETQSAGAVIEAAPLAVEAYAGTLAINLAPTAGDPLGVFNTAQTVGVNSTRPWTVQIGDVTGDGQLDIVTFNDLSSTVSVVAGNGVGEYGTPQVLSVGGSIMLGGELADMNNDGRLDIISANVASGNVSILNSLGGGNFSAPTVLAVGAAQARELAVGDLNGDGWNDIVSTNPAANTVSVLMSNGAGGFNAPQLVGVGTGATSPFGVKLGDVNGDGRLDIVTTNFTSNSVSVLTANEQGGFNTPAVFGVGVGAASPVKLTLGDVTGDGVLDIVTANQTTNNISVLAGNGAGGFGPAQLITTGVTQLDVSVADINGDGKNDILATSGAAKAIVVTANGTGGFNAPQLLNTGGANTSSIQVVDINGDTRLDLVVSNYYSAGVGILTAVGEISRTAEDTAVSVALKGSDADGTIASFQISTLPAHGSLYLDAGLTQLVDGSTVIAAAANAATLYFKPDANWNGSTSLAYVAVDNLGAAALAPYTYPIVVAAANDAPTPTGAQLVLAAGKEGSTYSINQTDLLQGWSDVDGDTLTVSGLTAQNGTLVNNNDGSWTFTPAANFNGTVNLAYNVIDGQGGTTAASQSFNLAPLNTPPALTGTKATLTAGSEDTTYTITQADLLAGWSDVDAGAVLGVQNLSATNGSLTAHTDGSWTFTPAANFNGTVDLSYDVTDGQGAATAATLSFGVTAVNDAPALTGAAAVLAGNEDLAYTFSKADLLQGWSDAEGNTLDIAGLSATNGTLADNGNNTWTFRPAANFNGSVDLAYNVLDGQGAATAANLSLAIAPVNDAPQAGLKFNGYTAQSYSVGGQAYTGLALGDVNGDGVIDAVTSTYAYPGAGSISVLTGNGAGGFNVPLRFQVAQPGVVSDLAMADVNGDGKLDIIATTNTPTIDTQIYLGDGAGGFTPSSTGLTGSAGAFVLADVNGDARVDVVATLGNSVAVLLGNVAGGFQARQTHAANGLLMSSVAVGDVNHDGLADIVSADGFTSTVSVLTGNGAGGFNAYRSFAVGSNPGDVMLGDVTGDGNLDIVTANRNSASVSVLAGDGAGGFNPAQQYSVGSFGAAHVVLGDVNADGRLDIVASVQNASQVAVLTANGQGGFNATQNFAVGVGPIELGLADLNGDGRLDVVTVNTGSGTVSALTYAPVKATTLEDTAVSLTLQGSDPDGTLGSFRISSLPANGSLYLDAALTQLIDTSTTIAASANAATIYFKPDLNWNGNTTLEYLAVDDLGLVSPVPVPHQVTVTAVNDAPVVNATGTLSFTENQAPAAIAPALSLVDVDSANLTGATVSISANFQSGADVLAFVNQNGITGTWNATTGTLTLTGTTSVANYEAALRSVAYVNTSDNPTTVDRTISFQANDGSAANGLSILSTHTLAVAAVNDAPLAETTLGTYKPAQQVALGSSASASFAVSVELSDVNGDGKLDIIAVDQGAGVSVLTNNGAGGWNAAQLYDVGALNPRKVVVGDVTGDGKVDIVTSNNSGSASVLAGDGAGGFSAAQVYAVNGTGVQDVALGDLNGDGRLDIITTNQSSNNVSILTADGAGGFAAAQVLAIGAATPSSVALGDVNGDNILDIVTSNGGSANSVSVLVGNGAGGFNAPKVVSIGITGTDGLALGDMNGDGNLDIVTTNATLTGDGAGNFSLAQRGIWAGGYEVELADVNNDGRLDIMVNAGANVGLMIAKGQTYMNPASLVGANGAGVTDVAVGDVNGDGRLDFVTSNYSARNIAVITSQVSSATANEDTTVAVTLRGVDADGTVASFRIESLPAHGTLYLNAARTQVIDTSTVITASANASTVYFQPDANWNGSTGLSVVATDNSGVTSVASAPYVINVTSVNDLPTLTGTKSPLVSGSEDVAYTINAADLLQGWSDVDTGAVLSIANLSASNGTLVNNNNGTWTFTPTANFAGTVNLNYQVIDSQGGATATTNTFTLAAVNDAPKLTGAQTALVAGTEDTSYTITKAALLQGWTDAEGNTFSLAAPTVDHGSAVLNADGSVTVTLQANYNGAVSLSYNVVDSLGSATAATRGFSVNGVNDAPVLTGSQGSLAAGAEGTVYTLTQAALLQGWSDVDADAVLSVSGLTATNGTLVNNNDGSWSFTPAANFNGTVDLAYNVIDGQGASVTATHSFGVVAVNDAPTAGAGSGAGFAAAQDYVSNGNPYDVALGDVNGDGRLDVVMVNKGFGTVSVLTGQAGGGLAAAQSYGVGAASPVGVALGDVNGDGRLDIVTANEDTHQVSVLTGQAGGGFAAAQAYAVNGTAPESVALGDVNGDGRLDIVTADLGSDQVSVLTGLAGGGFAQAQTYAVDGSRPRGVTLGDVNGDGRLDILTVNEFSHQVSVLAGQAGGGFAAAQTYAVNASAPMEVALGDVNGDGRIDLVTADAGSHQVSVLTGLADGGFAPAQTYATDGINPYGVVLGDVNGDGQLDIVAANLYGNTVSVLAGQAGGGFDAAQTYSALPGPYRLALGDMNGDGRLDIVVTELFGGRVSVLNGLAGLATASVAEDTPLTLTLQGSDADGTVASFRLSSLPAHGAVYTDAALTQVVTTGSVISATANVATLYFKPEANWSGSTSLAYVAVDNQGAESALAAIQPISVTAVNDAPALTGTAATLAAGTEDTAYTLTQADLLAGWSDADAGAVLGVQNLTASNGTLTANADGSWTFRPNANFAGNVDLSYNVIDGQGGTTAATHSFNLTAVNDAPIAGTPTLSFKPAHVIALNNTSSDGVAVADVNSDGQLDLLTTSPNSNQISVLLGNGAGGFGTAQTFSTGGLYSNKLSLGDVNGDGTLDIVTSNANSNTVSVLTGQGNGAFNTAVAYSTSGGNPNALALADVNGDGRLDIVAAAYGANQIKVLIGQGNGTFGAATTYASNGTNPGDVALGDVNGDGKLDIVAANVNQNTVSVLIGAGNGGFGVATGIGLNGALQPRAVELADINGDGKLDIITANWSSDISVLTGKGDGTFNTAVNYGIGGLNAFEMSLGDVNGDGRLDIVATAANSNKVSVLTGNGAGGFNAAQTFATAGIRPISVTLGDVNSDGKLDIIATDEGSTVSVLLSQGASSTTAEDTAVSVTLQGSDADGTLATFRITTLPAHGTLYLDAARTQAIDASTVIPASGNAATIYFLPEANWNGATSLSFAAVDNQGLASASTASVAITVTPVNDAPVLTGAQAQLAAGTEDTSYTISAADLLAGWSDADAGAVLNVQNLTASNGTLSANADGSWTFTPAANFNGTVNLAYNVVDGQGGTTAATHSFGVTPVNDPPALSGAKAALAAGTEDTTYTIRPADLLVGWTDTDAGAVLGVQNLTASNGTLTANANGSWTFTPAANFNGTVDLAYDVIDGQGGTTAATQSFSLTPVNDAPALTGTKAPMAAGTEDTAYTISQADLLAGWSDLDTGAVLGVQNLTATNGTLTANANGSWTFTPAANFNGTVNLAYNVVDGQGGSLAATQSFNLAAANDAPTAGSGGAGFAAAQNYAAGSGPQAVALGDLNGDGKLDIVEVNDTSNNLLVYSGNGVGGFSLTQNYAVGGSLVDYVTLGDVNGDGKLDAVTAAWSSSKVYVQLGDGAGGLGAAQGYVVSGTAPVNVALGDVNGDGKVDIVTGGAGTNRVSVLTGNGAGGFNPAQAYTVGNAPWGVALGDANGDGRLDIITADRGANQVSVLLANGSGGFNAAQSFALNARGPEGLVVGDVNGDGKLDIVVGNYDSSQVSVLTGIGAGGFNAAQTYATGGTGSGRVSLGDMNGDGRTDIVVANQASNQVAVLAGNGAGGFNAAQTYGTGGVNPWGLTVGDVNADGRADIVTANHGSNTISVLLNQSPSSVTAEDTTVSLTLQGSDADGTLATFRITTLPAHGTLYLDAAHTQAIDASTVIPASGNAATIYFQPEANWNGSTSLSFAALDNQGLASANAASVAITVTPVNDAPVATQALQDQTASEGSAFSVVVPADSFADLDSSALSYSATLADGSALPTWLHFDAATLTFSGTPVGTDVGQLTVTVRATDGALAASSSFVLGVDPVPVAPTSQDAAVETAEDTPVTLGSAAFAFADANAGDRLQFVTIEALPTTGALTLDGVAVLAGDQISAADIAAGLLVYAPELNLSGADLATLSFSVSDGLASSAPQLLNVSVTPANDAPASDAPDIVLDDSAEDEPRVITSADLLSTWADADADSLSVVDLSVSQGSLQDNGDGSWTFVPPANGAGPVTLSYAVTDGHGTVVPASASWAVTPVNDAPVAPDTATPLPGITEVQDIVITSAMLLAGWSDVDVGDSLSVVELAVTAGHLADNGDGSWTYTAVPGLPSPVEFSFQVSDGQGGLVGASTTLDLTRVDNTPRLSGEASILLMTQEDPTDYVVRAVDLLHGWSNAYGDPLQVQGLAADHGSFVDQGDGSWLYLAEPDYFGVVQLSYTVTNGLGNEAAAALDFELESVNDAPVNTVPGEQTVDEDVGLAISGLSVSDVDVGSGLVTATLSVAHGQVSGLGQELGSQFASVTGSGSATVTVSGTLEQVNATLASVAYLGDANFHGADTLTLISSDGQITTTDQVAISVISVNDAPQVGNIDALADTQEDSAVPIGADLLLQGITDGDGDALVIAELSVDQGSISGNAADGWVYTPPADYFGPVVFSYTVSDGLSEPVAITRNLALVSVNDLPVLQAQTADQQAAQGYGFAASLPADMFADVEDGASLTITASLAGGDPLPAWLSFDAGTGTFSGTPSAEDASTGTTPQRVLDIVVSATDSDGATVSDSFTLTVFASRSVTGTAGANALVGNLADETLSGLAGNDTLSGLGGNDTLDGGTGSDSLIGGLGDDSYVVDAITDVVVETGGEGLDTVLASVSLTLSDHVEVLVLTGAIAINGIGNTLDNLLTGNSAANLLNGLGGIDTLVGGAGNDTYVVDSADDLIVEVGGQGVDTVQTTASSYTLGAEVENLTITGTAAASATGNELANTLTGNAADNVLDGQAGADRLVGGAGNDTYVIDTISDAVVEVAAQGIDTVVSAVSGYTLAVNAENLVLTGAATIGTGNTADNVLTANRLLASSLNGGTGNDTLVGGAGNDTLTGAAGNDVMQGGAGDDSYVVDGLTDVITELAGDGIDSVSAAITYTLGANIENLVLTGITAINGTGNAGANSLTGNSAANVLDGLAGADTLAGLGGNDTYVVDDAGDVVVEAANQGTDLVQARVSHSLSINVENLTLIGTLAINAMGNALANTLTGNAADNVLDGGAGIDRLVGGLGNDSYVIDSISDVVTEALNQGTDTVIAQVNGYTLAANVENLSLAGAAVSATGNTANNVITGNVVASNLNGGAGNDRLIGQAGNDTLTGAAGNDTLEGGAGNDSYVVDVASDVIVELAGGGIDSVSSAVTYTLGANVENLTLTGTLAINGTGSADANTLTGNSAANVLDGAAGADTLVGGLGNDTYIVDNVGDVVTEALNQGTDLVQSSLNYTLVANVENLTLTGTAVEANGNELINRIIGNAAANRFDGGLGSDTITGGAGNDQFIFDTTRGTANVDTITDFTTGDLIVLDAALYGGIGLHNVTLDATMLRQGAGVITAGDANDHLIFNTSNGAMYYDPDGAGGVAATQFATLTGVRTVTAGSIYLADQAHNVPLG